MQPVQHIPVMGFPRARSPGGLLPYRKVQQRHYHLVDFVISPTLPIAPRKVDNFRNAWKSWTARRVQERVVAGLDYAWTHGTKSGRSLGRPRCVFDRNAVHEMRAGGQSWRAIAAHLRVGVGTVRRAYERKPMARELSGLVDAAGAVL